MSMEGKEGRKSKAEKSVLEGIIQKAKNWQLSFTKATISRFHAISSPHLPTKFLDCLYQLPLPYDKITCCWHINWLRTPLTFLGWMTCVLKVSISFAPQLQSWVENSRDKPQSERVRGVP